MFKSCCVLAIWSFWGCILGGRWCHSLFPNSGELWLSEGRLKFSQTQPDTPKMWPIRMIFRLSGSRFRQQQVSVVCGCCIVNPVGGSKHQTVVVQEVIFPPAWKCKIVLSRMYLLCCHISSIHSEKWLKTSSDLGQNYVHTDSARRHMSSERLFSLNAAQKLPTKALIYSLHLVYFCVMIA